MCSQQMKVKFQFEFFHYIVGTSPLYFLRNYKNFEDSSASMSTKHIIFEICIHDVNPTPINAPLIEIICTIWYGH